MSGRSWERGWRIGGKRIKRRRNRGKSMSEAERMRESLLWNLMCI